MISAVESPFGTGRQYYAGPPAANLLPPCPIPIPSAVSMSVAAAAEFVRPHPKPRYNGGLLRTNLTASPRSTKYSTEQTGPVNLAVSQSTVPNQQTHVADTSQRLSATDAIVSASHQASQSDRDTISATTMTNLFLPSKLAYGTPPSAGPSIVAGTPAGYPLPVNYSSLYGRDAPYGTPQLYSPHILTTRNQLHHRPTYISSSVSDYGTYLPSSVAFSPPGVPVSLPQLPIVPVTSSVQHTQPPSPLNGSMTTIPTSANNQQSISIKPALDSRSHLQHPQIHSHYPYHLQQQQHHQSLPPPPPRPPLPQSPNRSPGQPNNGSSMPTINGRKSERKELDRGDGKMASNFKVPSGKEGSMKHRILTRPYGERGDSKRRSPIQVNVVRSSTNNNTQTNFTKGSLIELANGELRRVEEMRTEDFLMSSKKNPELQLTDTTVTKISAGQQTVIITFRYNNTKIDMEATPEHPFFVYGQGWASCNPELSMQTFGLKCQRLQVGDICISLTRRETVTAPEQPVSPKQSPSTISNHRMSPPQSPSSQSSHTSTITTPTSYNYHPMAHLNYNYHPLVNAPHMHHLKDDLRQLPQNLSRKQGMLPAPPLPPLTVPTTATGTTVTSRQFSQSGIDLNHQLYSAAYMSHIAGQTKLNGLDLHSIRSNGTQNRHSIYDDRRQMIGRSDDPSVPLNLLTNRTYHLRSPIEYTTAATGYYPPPDELNKIDDRQNGSPAVPIKTPSPNYTNGDRDRHTPITVDSTGDTDIIDATLSTRKRRWSAPDNNLCDDEPNQTVVRNCN